MNTIYSDCQKAISEYRKDPDHAKCDTENVSHKKTKQSDDQVTSHPIISR